MSDAPSPKARKSRAKISKLCKIEGQKMSDDPVECDKRVIKRSQGAQHRVYVIKNIESSETSCGGKLLKVVLETVRDRTEGADVLSTLAHVSSTRRNGKSTLAHAIAMLVYVG